MGAGVKGLELAIEVVTEVESELARSGIDALSGESDAMGDISVTDAGNEEGVTEEDMEIPSLKELLFGESLDPRDDVTRGGVTSSIVRDAAPE